MFLLCLVVQIAVREFVTVGFKFRKNSCILTKFNIRKNSSKFIALFWSYVYIDNGVFFLKNPQATTKCDAESNWSTCDFIHCKIEKKTGQQR